VRKYDLPIIFEESFDNTKLFCERYPDLKVIIPHVGMSNDRIGGGRRVISKFKHYPNVYIETSIAFPLKIVDAILQFGPDRVIFGSDSPWSSPKIELFNLLEYDLMKYFNEEDMEKILAKNMLRLMNISLQNTNKAET
jgi:predicted TIM-barrel fold metal-dependent hydrolase